MTRTVRSAIRAVSAVLRWRPAGRTTPSRWPNGGTSADLDERQAVAADPRHPRRRCRADEPFSDAVRDALLSALFHAGSDFVLIALPDVFGWRDRINTPAIVNDANWTWRLPWEVERLMTEPLAVGRAEFLGMLSGRRLRR